MKKQIQNKFFYILLLFTCIQAPAFANNIREVLTDSIIKRTEIYITERIAESVEDRYGLTSIFRVLWEVPFSNNESRKERWKRHFEEYGVSKDSIQHFMNEQIKEFNAMVPQKQDKLTPDYFEFWTMEAFPKVDIPNLNVIDEASFESILKRDRYELICWMVGLPLELIAIALICGTIGAIIVVIFDVSSENAINLLVNCFCILATLGVTFWLADYFLAPIEVEITNSIIENLFQQISNMNIFEQL